MAVRPVWVVNATSAKSGGFGSVSRLSRFAPTAASALPVRADSSSTCGARSGPAGAGPAGDLTWGPTHEPTGCPITMCAFVPDQPNELTPATRTGLPAGQGEVSAGSRSAGNFSSGMFGFGFS
jgi:hypothetical protein